MKRIPSSFKTAIALAVLGVAAFGWAPIGEAAVISHWSFNGGTVGNTINNAGDAVGGVTVSRFEGASPNPGDDVKYTSGPTGFGTAANFDNLANGTDGQGAALKSGVPQTGDLVGLSALTVDAFVYIDSGTTLTFADSIFRKSNTVDDGGELDDGYSVTVNPDGKLQLRLGRGNTAGQRAAVRTAGALTRDAWVHVAATWDGGTGAIKLYLDGSEVATEDTGLDGGGATSLTGSLNGSSNDGPAAIGALVRSNDNDVDGDTGQFFDGFIDDLAVWDDALTPGEVKALADTAFQAELRYDSGMADQLFEVHDAGSGTTDPIFGGGTLHPIGLQWTYATGLGSTAGLTGSGQNWSLVIDGSAGTGLISSFGAVVPEPSSLALLGIGALVMRLLRRRWVPPRRS
jgi:hypothetical protein